MADSHKSILQSRLSSRDKPIEGCRGPDVPSLLALSRSAVPTPAQGLDSHQRSSQRQLSSRDETIMGGRGSCRACCCARCVCCQRNDTTMGCHCESQSPAKRDWDEAISHTREPRKGDCFVVIPRGGTPPRNDRQAQPQASAACDTEGYSAALLALNQTHSSDPAASARIPPARSRYPRDCSSHPSSGIRPIAAASPIARCA